MVISQVGFPRIFRALLLLAACCIALSASANNPGKKSAETESKNKALVQAAFEAWAAGTGGPFSLLTDDANWTIVGKSLASKSYPNKEAFMAEVIRPFNARMSKPLKPSVRNIYADGDTVVVFFDAQGTATDGKPYVNTYVWVMEMVGGKANRVWAFFDAIEFNDLWTRVKPTPTK